MAGTYEGGLKAAAENKRRYGGDFYRGIGKLGGKKSRGGGFMDRQLAAEAGRKGGLISRRKARIAQLNTEESLRDFPLTYEEI